MGNIYDAFDDILSIETKILINIRIANEIYAKCCVFRQTELEKVRYMIGIGKKEILVIDELYEV